MNQRTALILATEDLNDEATAETVLGLLDELAELRAKVAQLRRLLYQDGPEGWDGTDPREEIADAGMDYRKDEDR